MRANKHKISGKELEGLSQQGFKERVIGRAAESRLRVADSESGVARRGREGKAKLDPGVWQTDSRPGRPKVAGIVREWVMTTKWSPARWLG